jgi:hypothetical protein
MSFIQCSKCGKIISADKVMEYESVGITNETSIFMCSLCFNAFVSKDLNTSEVKE